ncbi:hypothetical protein DNTS_025738, partial [Danionella cerebrum]
MCFLSHDGADIYEPKGQQICKRGTEKPCYKIAYFQDNRRKLNFEEASKACRSDGGHLLSIESKSEQRLIEGFIHELKASDGDFWIGLRRNQGYEEMNGDCQSQYYWLDGSPGNFRIPELPTVTGKVNDEDGDDGMRVVVSGPP